MLAEWYMNYTVRALEVSHAPHYIIVASHSSIALLGGYQASVGKGLKHISGYVGTGKAAIPTLIRPISPSATHCSSFAAFRFPICH